MVEVTTGVKKKEEEFRTPQKIKENRVPFYFYEFDKWPAVVGLITGNFMTDVHGTNAKKRLRLYLGTVYRSIET